MHSYSAYTLHLGLDPWLVTQFWDWLNSYRPTSDRALKKSSFHIKGFDSPGHTGYCFVALTKDHCELSWMVALGESTLALCAELLHAGPTIDHSLPVLSTYELLLTSKLLWIIFSVL